MDQVFAGSNPVGHPTYLTQKYRRKMQIVPRQIVHTEYDFVLDFDERLPFGLEYKNLEDVERPGDREQLLHTVAGAVVSFLRYTFSSNYSEVISTVARNLRTTDRTVKFAIDHLVGFNKVRFTDNSSLRLNEGTSRG